MSVCRTRQPADQAANKMSVTKYQCCFHCYNHVPDRDRDDGVNRNASCRGEKKRSWSKVVILEEEGKKATDGKTEIEVVKSDRY